MCRSAEGKEDGAAADHITGNSDSDNTDGGIDGCDTNNADGSDQYHDMGDEDYPNEPLDHLMQRYVNITATTALHVLPTPPIGCGIFRNLKLLGIFPTARWLTDPTMPADVKELFGGTPFFALGRYKVAWMDLMDGTQRWHSLTFIINDGVPGLCTGYWGGVFVNARCWARCITTDEDETTVRQQPRASTFVDHAHLEFDADRFASGTAIPGVCSTQLERLLGLAVEYLLLRARWDLLPQQLVQFLYRDAQGDRRQARRQLSLASKKYKRFVR